MSEVGSCHAHGNCELCDHLDAEIARLTAERRQDAIDGQAALDEANNRVAALTAEVAALGEASRAALRQADGWLHDCACAECCPDSDMLVDGFRCGLHRTLALLANLPAAALRLLALRDAVRRWRKCHGPEPEHRYDPDPSRPPLPVECHEGTCGVRHDFLNERDASEDHLVAALAADDAPTEGAPRRREEEEKA